MEYPHDEMMRVFHETIYKSLFIQACGVLKKSLMDHLRSTRKMRRARNWTSKGQPRGRIIEAISIRDRPLHGLQVDDVSQEDVAENLRAKPSARG